MERKKKVERKNVYTLYGVCTVYVHCTHIYTVNSISKYYKKQNANENETDTYTKYVNDERAQYVNNNIMSCTIEKLHATNRMPMCNVCMKRDRNT